MFFTEEQKEQIIEAIRKAEKNTSGEIKVHIEENCPIDAIERAKEVFDKLELHQTAQRNAVLIYMATKDRCFAVMGDEGIYQKLPPHFWEETKNAMKQRFLSRYFAEGICEGIHLCGQQLKKYFPYNREDVNEISDDISFGS